MLIDNSAPERKQGKTTVWLDFDLPRKYQIMIDPDDAGTGRFHNLNCVILLELIRVVCSGVQKESRSLVKDPANQEKLWH